MLKNKRRLITTSLTIAAAVATAHIMQSGAGTPSPASAASAVSLSAATGATVPVPARNEVKLVAAAAGPMIAPAVGPTTEPVADTANSVPEQTNTVDSVASLPVPPQDTLMPAPLPQVGADLQARMARVGAERHEILAEQPRRNEFGLSCGPILTTQLTDAAMVGLTLTAPCRGGQTVTVHHGALAFTGKLDHLGTFMVAVPAMARDAEFAISFANGESIESRIEVPQADTIERAALMYEGASGLQIHALEFGADYGEEGHVWAGAPRNAENALKSGGGFMTVLGDESLPDSMRAQVYTYPGIADSRDGVVRLSVEAEVTAYNCATEVSGKTIEPRLGGGANSVSLTVAIPDCTAIGEYLVLKNLLRDLKIASN